MTCPEVEIIELGPAPEEPAPPLTAMERIAALERTVRDLEARLDRAWNAIFQIREQQLVQRGKQCKV